MKIMLIRNNVRKPLLWIVLCILSACGVLFSLRFFSKSFPIVDLNLTMDRSEALQKAADLAQKLHIGPESYKEAALFDVDSLVQHYIELEAGGPKAFGQLIQEGDYRPYLWKVRHFNEFDSHEAYIYFSPDGNPYGFTQKIPESEQGAALTEDEARHIAVDGAQKHWNVNFELYKNIETFQEITSSGRIDHTFVYERVDKKVGNAPYRLKLIVRGDQLSKLKFSVKVPESFKQKYQEMRSSNNIIAFTATIIMILLYVFCGAFFGLFFLGKLNWLEWRWPLICALIIGILQGLVVINEIPLSWFWYDTAIATTQFIGQLFLRAFTIFFIYAGVGALLIMIAEGLTRKAFKHHVQLWKIWDLRAAASWQVLGRTLMSYLLLGLDFAYAIGFYYIALRYFGWWSPSEALYNPDTLATYFPWLSSIALSLGAGFLEECLFRAIPLAGAALLGDRFGKRSLFVGIMFIVQALVFGAVHANYPAQPAYARLVELIVPSFVFGGLYLYLGLLPAIISHFIYDVVWFSLPIFISHAPGILFNKLIIIVMCFIPLFIVLYRRLQCGKWLELAQHYYNSSWKPPQRHLEQTPIHEEKHHIYFTKKRFIAISVIGIASALVWCLCSRFTYDTFPIGLTRAQAIGLAEKIGNKDNDRSVVATTDVPLLGKDKSQHIYIWRTFGEDVYKKLLKSYLMPALWKVRFVYFDGSLEKRADEYNVQLNSINNQTIIYKVHHKIAEEQPGESLSLQEARSMALGFIKNNYGLQPEELFEISAVPTKHPHRTNWTFVFNDLSHAMAEGQARISVEISGKEISDFYRYIFVPEQWERTYKNENSLKTLMKTINYFALILFLIFAAFIIVTFSKYRIGFDIKIYLMIMVALLIKSCIQACNIWPVASAAFNTNEPFLHQAWTVVIFWLVSAIFLSNAYGIIGGLLQKIDFKSAQLKGSLYKYIFIGSVFGLCNNAFHALVKKLHPLPYPDWPSFTSAAAYVPFVSQALSMLSHYIEMTLILLLVVTAVDYCTRGWTINRWGGLLMFVVFSCLTSDVGIYTSMWWWLFVTIGLGIIITVIYAFMLRHCKASIPCVTASAMIVNTVPLIVATMYPGAVVGSIVGSSIILAVSIYWAHTMLSYE